MVQQQKILLYVFPVIFAVTGINFPVGVLIYWFTTNLWSMGQQFYVIRNNPQPDTPAYEAWEKRRRRSAPRRTAASTRRLPPRRRPPAQPAPAAARSSRGQPGAEPGAAEAGAPAGLSLTREGRRPPAARRDSRTHVPEPDGSFHRPTATGTPGHP